MERFVGGRIMRGIEILSTVLMAVLVAPSAFGASNITDFSSLDRVIQEELKTTNTPGCAVAIVSGDNLVYAKGFGVANLETGQLVTPDTLFLIGSTVKQFTAYTVLSMAEDGRLDINRPIGNYIKGLSPRLSSVTASQLLSHTAGLKDMYPWPENIKWDFQSGLEKGVRTFNDSIFLAEPGEVFSYSNDGYNLAGYLAQVVGGMPYADAVEEKVLQPVGMNNTTFHLEMAVTHPMAMGYTGRASKNLSVLRPFQDYATELPSGFLFSNVLDMARYARAMMNNGTLDGGRVLSPEVIKEMRTPHADMAEGNISYGYGLMMHSYRGVDVVEHEGNLDSFTCIFKMVPEHKFALIILDNGVSREMPNSTKKAFEMMLPLLPEIRLTPRSMNESEMARYAGIYMQNLDPAINCSVIVKNGRLWLNANGRELPMEKVGVDLFAIYTPGKPDPMYIGFIPGKDGRIKYLHFGSRALYKIGY